MTFQLDIPYNELLEEIWMGNTSFGQTTGYYYYTLADGLSAQEDGREAPCIIVLLSPSTCEEGLPFMESVHIRGRVLAGNPAFQTVLENLAKDLNWTKQGISEKVSNCFVRACIPAAPQHCPSGVIFFYWDLCFALHRP